MAEDKKRVILDFEDDPEIRGQKYALVSFLEPSSIFQKKDAYFWTECVKNMWGQIDGLLNSIKENYPEFEDGADLIRRNHDFLTEPKACHEFYEAFVGENWDALHEAFQKKFYQQTKAIRSIKIRGVVDTIDEGKKRVEKLKKTDKDFNIYMIDVGRWVPFSPPSNAIPVPEDEQSELTKLIEGVKNNNLEKELDFEKRKSELREKSKGSGIDLISVNNSVPTDVLPSPIKFS